jgi:hypothetical protein
MTSACMDCFTAFAMTGLFMERSVSDVAIHEVRAHGLPRVAHSDKTNNRHYLSKPALRAAASMPL